jgi:hypothetical protein
MYRSTFFFTSARVGSEWSASCSGCFTTEKTVPTTHRLRGWVGPEAGLNDVEKKNSSPYRDSNSDPSVVQPVASRYTDWAISTL